MSNNLSNLGALTVVARIRADSIPAASERQTIFAAQNLTSGAHTYLLFDESALSSGTNGTITFVVSGSTTADYVWVPLSLQSAGVDPLTGDYFVCAGTFDAGVVEAYASGSLATAMNTVGAAPANSPTCDSMAMGRRPLENDRFFDGAVHWMRVYNRALTQSELDTLNNGDDVSSGLVHHWHADDIIGTSWPDQVGTGFGVITGQASPDPHSIMGKLGPTVYHNFLEFGDGLNRGSLGSSSKFDLTDITTEVADGHTWLKGAHQASAASTGHEIFGSGTTYSATVLVRKSTTAYAGVFGGRSGYPNISVFFNGKWEGGDQINAEHFLADGTGVTTSALSVVNRYALLTMVRDGSSVKLYDGKQLIDEVTTAPATEPVKNQSAALQWLQDGGYIDGDGRIGISATFDKALTLAEIHALTDSLSEYTGLSL